MNAQQRRYLAQQSDAAWDDQEPLPFEPIHKQPSEPKALSLKQLRRQQGKELGRQRQKFHKQRSGKGTA